MALRLTRRRIHRYGCINAGINNNYTAMPLILKQGSKGKQVELLQKFLNLKAKLPKPIKEDGDFGPATKEAVKFFQKKAGLKVVDGGVGPETAGALGKLVGPAAATFVKAFGELPQTDSKKDPAKEKADASASAKGGTPGKVGNVIHGSGNYKISIPPNPNGAFPLVVLFAGTTHIAPVFAGTPDSYFKNAILVFSEASGSFTDAQSHLKPLLAATQTRIGSVSICGYSLGGIPAFRDYGHATKSVGLIDPTTHNRDIAKLDNKAIYSCNPDNWTDPNYALIKAAQIEAGKSGHAGVYERTTIGHAAYPKYFLAKFESSLY